jgi:hypothetical protein
VSAARYFTLTLLSLGIIYALAIAASLLFQPEADVRGINTVRSSDSLFATETKYLMFSLNRLDHPGPRTIVLGASNAEQGLEPAMLMPRLGMPVYNLSIGGSNIREMQEITYLCFDNMPVSAWRQSTFVAGVWYGQFVPDSRRWPDGQTDIDTEAQRYHLYTVSDYHVHRRLSPVGMKLATLAMRPFLVGLKIYYNMDPLITRMRTTSLQILGYKIRIIGESDTLELTPAERKAETDEWSSRMGPLKAWDMNGFDGLVAMARMVSAHGARFVVLDLPLPGWHKAAVPYDAEYRRRLAALMPRLCAIPNVSVVSLKGFSDDDFYDFVHPRPRVMEQWAQKTAALIALGHQCAS